MEKCREYNIPLWIAFVDYEKTFDSMQTQAILTSLQEQGIEDECEDMMLKCSTYKAMFTRDRYRTAECVLTLTCVSTIRANVTHILARTHTPTQYSYISLLLHQAKRTTIGNSMPRNQHARTIVSQALCYANTHITNHIIHIWLIFLVKQMQHHSMFWDHYLSQTHSHQCAELYLSSDGDRLHLEAIPWNQ